MQRADTIVNVQILRFFAAFWVAFYHSKYFVNGQADILALPRFLRFIQNAGFVGVDIFFVISGAIMALTTYALPNTPRNSARFLSIRFARIYTGWWPLFPLYWIGAMLSHNLKDKWFFASLLLLPVNLPHYITGILWTLSFELYFYCLVALLILAPLHWRHRIFGVALAGVATLTIWATTQGYFTPARQAEAWPVFGFIFFPLVAEFIAGFLLYRWVRSRQPRRVLPWALGALCFFLTATAYQTHIAGPQGIHLEGFFAAPARALFVGGFAVCLLACALIAKPWLGRAGRAFSHLGDASYAIYLSHIVVMLAATKLLQAVGWSQRIYTPTLVILLTAVLAFSALYHRKIEHPLYQWVRKRIDQGFTHGFRPRSPLPARPVWTEVTFAPSRVEYMSIAGFFGALLMWFGMWHYAFWPGVLGPDSKAVLWEVEKAGQFHSGKSTFWFLFVNSLYAIDQRVKWIIGVQLMVAVLVFARILGWIWPNIGPRWAIALGLLICVAPHTMLFSGTLYPDGIFSIATIGLAFELWICLKKRSVSALSFLMLAATIPFALFTRSNGIIMLVPMLYTAYCLAGRERSKFLLISALWVLAIWGGVKATSRPQHGAIFPLVLYETANFLQPRPTNLPVSRPRVHPETIDLLTKYATIETIQKYYDRDYWDPLVQHAEGPQLGRMARADEKKIIRHFWQYNLWENFPAFVSSRVNIFMVSALAKGGIVRPELTQSVLEQLNSKSTVPYRGDDRLRSVFESLETTSYQWRWLLWNPLPGVVLLLLALRRKARDRGRDELIILVTFLAQLGGIFLFSVAGEYRYVLMFFLLPLALIPMLLHRRSSSSNLGTT